MGYINDMNLAMLEFDIKPALETQQMFADAGKERIRVQELLQQCLGKIDNWQEQYERLARVENNSFIYKI